MNGNNYILKYYKLGYKYPENVLTAIKNNPKNNVIKLFEFGSRNGQDFEIMEYAEGGTLDHYLKESGPIRDINKLKQIASQINEGLNQLHSELRIIYQDLKPENIYFKDKNKTKIVLADFGISNIMKSGKNEADVKANVTKEYAAPELSRTGNESIVTVGPHVDYFASRLIQKDIITRRKRLRKQTQAGRKSSETRYSKRIRFLTCGFRIITGNILNQQKDF